VQQQPELVDQDMAFLALDQLACVEAMWIEPAQAVPAPVANRFK
jgi:hypothetical protein